MRRRGSLYNYILVEFVEDNVQYLCKEEYFDKKFGTCRWKDGRFYPARILKYNLNKAGK